MIESKALRLKIYFENETNIERIVEVEGNSTLEDLHLTIMAAFELSAGEMSSFWLSDKNTWQREQEIPMIRMIEGEGGEESASMADVQTASAVNEQRPCLIYEYDMLLLWVLRIEFMEVKEKQTQIGYPVLIRELGKAPNADKARAKLLSENTAEQIAEDLLKEGGNEDDYGLDGVESDVDLYN